MTLGITRPQACLAAAGGALWGAAGTALAQAYPTRPPHLIVPFTPGGSSDVLGRAIGQELAAHGTRRS